MAKNAQSVWHDRPPSGAQNLSANFVPSWMKQSGHHRQTTGKRCTISSSSIPQHFQNLPQETSPASSNSSSPSTNGIIGGFKPESESPSSVDKEALVSNGTKWEKGREKHWKRESFWLPMVPKTFTVCPACSFPPGPGFILTLYKEAGDIRH